MPPNDSLSRDCYIVRIYRRDSEDLQKIAGIVEAVGSEESHPFKTFEELTKIMSEKTIPCPLAARRISKEKRRT